MKQSQTKWGQTLNYVNFVTLLNCPKQAWAERLRYWNSLETAQNTVQLELRFSP